VNVSETENTDDVMDAVNEHEPILDEEHDLTHMLSKIRFPSCRLVLVFMGFLGFLNVYILRVNLSIALVAMVNHTQLPYSNLSDNYSTNSADDVCESSESTGEQDEIISGEFNWDSHTQGTVLAAFFYGYIFTQV